MTLSIDTNGSTTLSKARARACFEAACEVEALAVAVPDYVPRMDGLFNESLVVRGMAARLVELANVLLAGLGDDAVATQELEKRVTHIAA